MTNIILILPGTEPFFLILKRFIEKKMLKETRNYFACDEISVPLLCDFFTHQQYYAQIFFFNAQ